MAARHCAVVPALSLKESAGTDMARGRRGLHASLNGLKSHRRVYISAICFTPAEVISSSSMALDTCKTQEVP